MHNWCTFHGNLPEDTIELNASINTYRKGETMQRKKENGGGRNGVIGKGIYIRKLVNGAESC